jgi:magnesium-transporting ATPase (P-type)
VLTRFNAILGALFAVVLVVGPPQDALFGAVLVINTGIGVAQELRAKRALDRLAILTAGRARAVRDSAVTEIALDRIVLDDVLELGRGDQVPVDGTVLCADGLELDEALLTGEAEPVRKQPGDQVLSGSVVVAGSARIRADVLCIDKTGTLTEPGLRLIATEVVTGRAGAHVAEAIGALAAADEAPNETGRLLSARYPAPVGWATRQRVP